MLIKDLFEKRINRPMDGVIQVEKVDEKAVREEIEEFVVTNELRKHFRDFCTCFADSFENRATATGVWISGHFGCGKSHFLKMLSYLLENRKIDGVQVIEIFREKFKDDPALFMTIEKAASGRTDSILFDIDASGMNKKDDTVIIRIFAKKFYEYLGFYGDSLKIAQMEMFIEEKGLTEQFRKTFEEKNGEPWVDARNRAGFFQDDVIDTLHDVVGMSVEAAERWFENTDDEDEYSIEKLIHDIKEFVDTKPNDYRLLFMIDEVGQYIGENKSMLLNLQTILEKIGDECDGKVWVVCTGQEALDKIIKAREDEFGRIMGRFRMRLSLSASSVDEIIKQRLLTKTPEARTALEGIYEKEDANLKNVISFSNAVKDVKGYSNVDDFVSCYPFAPYQFKILQRVYDKAREGGNVSIHHSSGARSMLSGFQESAKALMEEECGVLVPFWMFYETMETALDTSVRDVITRCKVAAFNHDGIEEFDVKVLKLLFMIHYISQDIPSNIENLIVLMSDSIDVDRSALRTEIKESLDRLLSQNYISRTGECYNFLSDDEQEIQRGINKMVPPNSGITKKILDIIYGDIYQSKKLTLGGNNFGFNQSVDTQSTGSLNNEMGLRFLSVVTDETEKTTAHLMLRSKNDSEAIIVLADTGYYKALEMALKVEAYCSDKNITSMPERMREIIRKQREEATRLEAGAKQQIEAAIMEGTFYIDGDKATIPCGDAKSKITAALEQLTNRVYFHLDLVKYHAKSDSEIRDILTGDADDGRMEDCGPNNPDAIPKVEQYIERNAMTLNNITMADVQDFFKKKPYGWLEIDIACIVAQLIHSQRVTVKYAGETIHPTDSRLPNMLRSKSEIGKLAIKKRQAIPEQKKREAIDFLRSYSDRMTIKKDEDGLVEDILEILDGKKAHYETLMGRYGEKHDKYPNYMLLKDAKGIIDDVLSQKKDNLALVNRLNDCSEDLEESKHDLADVEEFFINQVGIYDEAKRLMSSIDSDDIQTFQNYDDAGSKALGQIRLILSGKPFKYDRIKDLTPLMNTVRETHDRMISEKRAEILEVVRQCMEAIHTHASGVKDTEDIIARADKYYSAEKESINRLSMVSQLNGKIITLGSYKDETVERIDSKKHSAVPAPKPEDPVTPATPVKKNIKSVQRITAFPSKHLETEEQIDEYVESIRWNLKAMLSGCDGIQIK